MNRAGWGGYLPRAPEFKHILRPASRLRRPCIAQPDDAQIGCWANTHNHRCRFDSFPFLRGESDLYWGFSFISHVNLQRMSLDYLEKPCFVNRYLSEAPMDRHPSPLEIKAALLGELADDYDAHPYGSTDLTIPIRIYRLIDRAIEKAYARHNERKAA